MNGGLVAVRDSRATVPAPRAGFEQLALLDPFDDGLTWDEWFRALPLDPGGREGTPPRRSSSVATAAAIV